MGRGTFLRTKGAAAEMINRRKGGVIINMSSAAGKTGWSLLGAYTFAKFGIVAFAAVCGAELGPYKIRVKRYLPRTKQNVDRGFFHSRICQSRRHYLAGAGGCFHQDLCSYWRVVNTISDS